ncbi:hypothetical protein BamMEX5DRAFT_6360 [Burkholderia ambifaria MEX-5]|uniref:Uncharacterized protein n=1 Tax=Burkholderia ambifaria MEX-5 TaxID=396597 RepID=B1TEZ4_9BURK|nr:hypothetical protein BamMEX5DRAFT_6360 [Burkholderia ambifaria MEX-5]
MDCIRSRTAALPPDETSKVVHPGMRALNDPSNLPKTAAVWLSTSGNAGGNASLVQDAPVLVVIVASIRIDAFGPAQWPTANAFDRRDRLDQGDQLRDVIAVGAGQDCRDRCAVGVGGEVVFGTGSRSIGGVRARQYDLYGRLPFCEGFSCARLDGAVAALYPACCSQSFGCGPR